MKRVLIIGLGSVGEALRRTPWMSRYSVETATRTGQNADHQLDISRERSVAGFFSKRRFYDLVFNCAAVTDVDRCEKEPESARLTNALGVKFLASACALHRMPFLHISTNYVFAGTARRNFTERDLTNPCSAYGVTKCEGEYYALNLAPYSVVIRTSWIFGGVKRDFVNHFLEKLRSLDQVPVVAEPVACLTYVKDLAEAIEPIVVGELWPAVKRSRTFHRVYHLTNAGPCTRYDLLLKMKKILKTGNRVRKIPSHELQSWLAVRPRFSALSNQRYRRRFGKKLRRWEDALEEYLGGEE